MNTNLKIEILDELGNLVETRHGLSLEEQIELHDKGQCDAACPICYQEACVWKDTQEKEPLVSWLD